MSYTAADELRDRIAVLEAVSPQFVGVEVVEHLLVDLLAHIESGRVERSVVENEFSRLAHEWPPGAVEVLEFCLRRVRSEELRRALTETAGSAADFRHRDLARQVLEVYESDWPGGEIYRTYRKDSSPAASISLAFDD
ncbi:MAG: hypothetical protein ACT4P1_16845 [Sporichthyaceae bacterium]